MLKPILGILIIHFMFSFMNSVSAEHKNLPVEYTYFPGTVKKKLLLKYVVKSVIKQFPLYKELQK